VHSLSKLIAIYGGSGTTLNFVSPVSQRMPTAILDYLTTRGVRYYETEDLSEVIGESDVIYWTRIQEERFEDKAAYEAIADRFIMTPEVLARAQDNTILMHPLPRKHEMGTQDDHDILDVDPRSIYFRQMENGMYVRMVLLALTLGVKVI
jgi:aspartate carbamoyltransferase catalytic subunit